MATGMTSIEPLWKRLPRLREKRGLSRSLLSRHSARFGDEGVSEETIKRLELPPENRHHRRASAEVIEKLARALEVEPDEFPEYQLARQRALLDEREVDLGDAFTRLIALASLGSIAVSAITHPDEDHSEITDVDITAVNVRMMPHHGSVGADIDGAVDLIITEAGRAMPTGYIEVKSGKGRLSEDEMVQLLEKVFGYADPSIDIIALVGEVIARRSPTEAAERYRTALREAARHRLEHPEASPETPSDTDSRETGP